MIERIEDTTYGELIEYEPAPACRGCLKPVGAEGKLGYCLACLEWLDLAIYLREEELAGEAEALEMAADEKLRKEAA